MPYDPALDRYLEAVARKRKIIAAVKYELVQFMGCMIAVLIVGTVVSTALALAFFAAKLTVGG